MTTYAPSGYGTADILRHAHNALCCLPGRLHALHAIGIGTVGWGYDPRPILNPHDEARYEAAIAQLSNHLHLNDPSDPDEFTAWHDAPDRTPSDVLNALQDTARSLEGYAPDRVFTPTARDVTSVHQGVLLTCYGEEGSYMAIGHIPAALMISASSECSMHLTGEPLVDNDDTPAELEQRVRHDWTVHWRNPRGEHWWDIDYDRRTPGAVPATILPGE
ncbi:hypothetical protein ACFV4E_22825 [Streptomyces hygroscopicus]|uniref:Uncharacterized protein n=1 Tax=Streptomyces hygroscopicus TaxID=1912 RepID=A0ABQ3UFE5_STRHY|nr:hypothetical protein [Streptomyces hygroscopicus]GHJ34303.1 hypothetical protein TPA0910_87360 [Streptomyces hygroscopicus]